MNEFLQPLVNIKPQWNVRTRYGILREVLTVSVDEQLQSVTVKLSGLYAKIDYLIKQHHIRQNDRSLSFAMNDVRIRLNELHKYTDEELLNTWSIDLRAIATFVALISGEEIPETLKAQFPRHTRRILPKRLQGNDGKGLCYFRCTIVRWDNTHIYATREDTDELVRINYIEPIPFVPGDWTYLRKCMVEGAALNVIRPREKGDEILPELLIYAPDYLINVTSVTDCFNEAGISPFHNLLSRLKPFNISEPQLMGNFAGQLLDEVVYNDKDQSYADSMKQFFVNNALNILTCEGGLSPDFHNQAQQQKQNLKLLMGRNGELERQTNHEFWTEDLILEPSFFSDMLGLQGRMDFLALNYRIIIEQKSGKSQWNPNFSKEKYSGRKEPHNVQVLLYKALMHYDYEQLNENEMYAFLLYSKYADGIDFINSNPKLLFEAIKVRNQLAWAEEWYARGGMRVLETLTPEHICPKASGPLWKKYTRPQMEEVLAPIHRASPTERAYYFRFMQFIANEQALARIGNRTKENSGFASVWTSSIDDKREAGNIYENLTLQIDNETERVDNVTFCFSSSDASAADADLSNFRKGDIVFFYPYTKGNVPDATATIVFRCSITEITTDHVSVRLRNAQTSNKVFQHYRGCVWAIEHDFMEASFTAQYRGLHSLLTAPKHRRDLLLGQRSPEVDTSRPLLGDYNGEEFNQLVLQAQQAQDFYLVIGPPGTGKTSYGLTNLLKEELLHKGTNVLLLSYTNRAVDEICSKLVEEGIDFVRMGSDFSCEEAYKPYLLSERIKAMPRPNLAMVNNLLCGMRVFCGTTTSLCSALSLLKVKTFDLAIVDEASQILEPHILPLLCATREGNCAIRRFVLIGDEKQLPAVVQQTAEESAVTDELLHRIGLTDCRLSFFERMLHLHGYCANGSRNEQVCHMLTRQGRMHHDIALFPSQAFYDGSLSEVPLAHQTAPTPPLNPQLPWSEQLITAHRLAFVSCQSNNDPTEMNKVNQREATLVAQLVKQAYEQSPETFHALSSVGVIVPYRNQISTVRKAISQLGIEGLTDITIDTVERYQGSQRDVIIYSFTAKKSYQLAFLSSNTYIDPHTGDLIDRKLNVAMTRARKHLLLIGNAPLLEQNAIFCELINYCKKQHSFYDADTLIAN